jgi:hypothetical protein
MISAILMLRRLAGALRVALREEDFARILAAGLALIIIGTLAYSVGGGWSLVDGLYVAVATLTTSSVLDPKLTVTDPWLKVFTAGYVLVGIGILVEVARRLGTGFIVARAEVEKAKEAAKLEAGGWRRTSKRGLTAGAAGVDVPRRLLHRAAQSARASPFACEEQPTRQSSGCCTARNPTASTVLAMGDGQPMRIAMMPLGAVGAVVGAAAVADPLSVPIGGVKATGATRP